MIRFVEVLNTTNNNPRMERTAKPRYSLGEVWINEKYVVSVQEALGYKDLMNEGLLPPNLDGNHVFTLITVNSGDINESHVVVGAPDSVASRLNHTRARSLLKG